MDEQIITKDLIEVYVNAMFEQTAQVYPTSLVDTDAHIDVRDQMLAKAGDPQYLALGGIPANDFMLEFFNILQEYDAQMQAGEVDALLNYNHESMVALLDAGEEIFIEDSSTSSAVWDNYREIRHVWESNRPLSREEEIQAALSQHHERLSNLDYDILLPETALNWLTLALVEAGVSNQLIPSIRSDMKQVLANYPDGMTREQFFAEVGYFFNTERPTRLDESLDSIDRHFLQEDLPNIADELGIENFEEYEEFRPRPSYEDYLFPEMSEEERAARVDEQLQFYLDLAQSISQLPPEVQQQALESLSPSEQQILAQLFSENPIGMAGLDPSARAFLGLPTDDETLWAELEGLLQASSLGQQLQTAYQLLEGWNYESSIAELEGFLAMKETLPTELLGVPLTEMGMAAQTFHDDMLAYHEAMLNLRNQVFEAEGEGRINTLYFLSMIAPEMVESSWKNLILPDLIAILDEQEKSGAFDDVIYTPPFSFFDPLIGNVTAENDVRQHIDFYRGDHFTQQPEFKFAVGAGLFVGSFIAPEVDLALAAGSFFYHLATGDPEGALFDAGVMAFIGAMGGFWDDAASHLDEVGMLLELGTIILFMVLEVVAHSHDTILRAV